jgi:hypothetical protein
MPKRGVGVDGGARVSVCGSTRMDSIIFVLSCLNCFGAFHDIHDSRSVQVHRRRTWMDKNEQAKKNDGCVNMLVSPSNKF